jgi:hypothetical protein
MRAFLLSAMAMCASTFSGAQQLIPVRQLGPVLARASEPINAIANIRPLSDGRVLVGFRGRVMLFTADLSTFTTVFDSSKMTPGTSLASGQIPMISYLGDSTLLVDRNASSFVLLDPNGKVARAIAVPVARDLREISGFFGTRSGYIDPRGRLIYRGRWPADSDSMPILRADFETRALDTLGVVVMPSLSSSSMRADVTPMVRTTRYTAFPVIDLWTMLPDGTLAIARGRDYHLDWIDSRGARTSSPKLPFAWRRIPDQEKRRVLDSIVVEQTEMARRDSVEFAGRARPGSIVSKWTVANLNELPDYYPPVRETGMRADAEGNVWLLPTTSMVAQGGLVYDVVNRRGEVFERVQLPSGCALGAIARDGVVYLVCEGTRLERREVLRRSQ